MTRPLQDEWLRTQTRRWEVDCGKQLQDVGAGTTAALTGTPRVYLEQKVDGSWVDRSDEVTISGQTVVSAAVSAPTGSGVADARVQWLVTGVAVDAANPEAGTNYRWRIEADTDDGQEAGGEIRLTIRG